MRQVNTDENDSIIIQVNVRLKCYAAKKMMCDIYDPFEQFQK